MNSIPTDNPEPWFQQAAAKHIVLVGVGHTHAHVVRMWAMQRVPDCDLTCISHFPVATYSGRLPAVLAGQASESQMEIDLVQLCAAAQARLIVDEVIGIDHERRQLLFAARPPVAYDALSIGVGSVPGIDGVRISGDRVVPIKPMQSFLERLQTVAQHAVKHTAQQTLDRPSTSAPRLAIVGGGVAGIELALCLPTFLQQVSGQRFDITLCSADPTIAPELIDSARRRLLGVLTHRQVDLHLGAKVSAVSDRELICDNGTSIQADVIVWATGASAPPLLSRLQLPQCSRGFLLTEATLRCVPDKPIFAVGDSGTLATAPTPKAGVYAVRQGPVLWENLQRLLAGRPLQAYKPQGSFLKLMNCGDGTAVGQWKRFAFSGRWVMRLKERIDSRFLNMYQAESLTRQRQSMAHAAHAEHEASPDSAMQCRGCGCKLGAATLRRTLSATSDPSDNSPRQAAHWEDAVVVARDANERDDMNRVGGANKVGDAQTNSCRGSVLASTDFFSVPVLDAFLAGRITALHAASDLLISGATITEALANVVLPAGDESTQQSMLGEFLAGAGDEFAAMGARIAAGHTIVGPRWEAGFTVIGKSCVDQAIGKGNLQVGQSLYLTKPLGTGVLMAAHQRARCKASYFQQLIDAMLVRQHGITTVLADMNVRAATDVTGFGLAGHLLEMLWASKVGATIQLKSIPLLPGVADLIQSGIASSLAPSNQQAARSIEMRADRHAAADDARWESLFDPQTCGGFLIAISPAGAPELIERLQGAGFPKATLIGQVTAGQAGNPTPLRIE